MIFVVEAMQAYMQQQTAALKTLPRSAEDYQERHYSLVKLHEACQAVKQLYEALRQDYPDSMMPVEDLLSRESTREQV